MRKNQPTMKLGIFTGGGTGGHVYPGLAVWQKVSQWYPGRLLWIGSYSGMEKDIISKLGLPYKGIFAGKLRRYWSFQNFTDVVKILFGFLSMVLYFRRNRADFVFSKGGFVSVPVVWAARIFNIPVFSHESDLIPGLATKLNLGFSTKVFLPHEKVKRYLPARHWDKCVISGNPVREEIMTGRAERAEQRWNIPADKPLILVLGGSSGALQINNLIPSLVKELAGRAVVLHQTGYKWEIPQLPHYIGMPYLQQELADVLARADLLISRAGAGSLWEAASYKLPMVLVPLLAGSRGDQVVNARHWESMGCAYVLINPTTHQLNQVVLDLLEKPQQRGKMRESYQNIPLNSSALIAQEIQSSIF
jgi:UDP-N-acetylglucosamine--N-acetylmuramyl-(pentapeptide) pyrophosphoryl-undecaprenol N-acetylglucosamine transferase